MIVWQEARFGAQEGRNCLCAGLRVCVLQKEWQRASPSDSDGIINNHRTVLVDDVSNGNVKGQVHQAVTNSVGQEMFTKRCVWLQEWNEKANVRAHWRICWRSDKQNNYLSWVLDASSIRLYTEVQSSW